MKMHYLSSSLRVLFNLIALTLISTYLCSCTHKSKDDVYRIDYISCELEELDKTGYLGKDGVFIEEMNSSDECSSIINGVFFKDGTLYKISADISDSIPLLNNIEQVGIMNDDRIPVCKENDYITIIDMEGREIVKLQSFDDKEVLGCYSYSDSRLRVILEDYSTIYIDIDGNRLFGKRYSWSTDFKNGLAIAQTVDQNSNLYSLIDESGVPLFTFESKDEDFITMSYDLELLSTKENNRIILYDFFGNRVLECPSSVEGIYAYTQDGFIYHNDDDEFGLMSYEGKQLIRNKYDQLIPNGKKYLAVLDNDKECVLLINSEDCVVKEFDGDQILDFHHYGFDFPNMIETSREHYLVIDNKGNTIVEDLNLDIDYESIYNSNIVASDYFPREKVLRDIIKLCNDGNGLSDKYGAFFNFSGKHCYPKDITFLESTSKNNLIGYYSAKRIESKGVNYELSYEVVFDEPIVRTGYDVLNSTAWLKSIGINVYMTDMFRNQAFLNLCVHELNDKGCQVLYRKKTDYILLNRNQDIMYVIVHNWDKKEYEFSIWVTPYNESNKNYWIKHIENLSAKER